MAREPQGRSARPDQNRAPPLEGEIVDSTETATNNALVRVSDFHDMDVGVVAAIAGAHIDKQAEIAVRRPRKMQAAADMIVELATFNTEAARECMYALPRGRDPETGKPKAITGESIRFFEIVAQSWGNCSVDAYVENIDRRNKVVIAKGVFTDLQTNFTASVSVSRRISGKDGSIFNADMINVTAQAAIAIATRNAIKRGVPKPIWNAASIKVQAVIRGDAKTLGARRVELLTRFRDELGIKPADLFKALGVGGEMDIGLDELVVAAGFFTGLRNGEITFEDLLRDAGIVDNGARTLGHAFGDQPKPGSEPDEIAKAQASAQAASPPPPPQSPPPPPPPPPEASHGPTDDDLVVEDHARPKEMYFLYGDAWRDDDRRQLYQDGKPSSFGGRRAYDEKAIPVFRNHPPPAEVEQPKTEPEAVEEEAADIIPGPAPAGVMYGWADDPEGDDYAVYVDGVEVERRDTDAWDGLPIYEEHAPRVQQVAEATTQGRGRRGAPAKPAEGEQRQEETSGPTETKTTASPPTSAGSPAPSGLEEAIAAYRTKVQGAESWLQIKAALGTLGKNEAFRALPDDMAKAERVYAYSHGQALAAAGRDPVSVLNDPHFFLLWLDTEPGADEIDLAFAKLFQSAAYKALNETFRDTIAGEIAKAKGG